MKNQSQQLIESMRALREMMECPDCHGSGKMDGKKCETCDGKGEVEDDSEEERTSPGRSSSPWERPHGW